MNSSAWFVPPPSSHTKRPREDMDNDDDDDDQSFLQEPFKRLRVDNGQGLLSQSHHHQDVSPETQPPQLPPPLQAKLSFYSSLQQAASVSAVEVTAAPQHVYHHQHQPTFSSMSQSQEQDSQHRRPLWGQHAGQESSEHANHWNQQQQQQQQQPPPPDYASMNHMLGSLHQERRMRKQQEYHPPQPQQPHSFQQYQQQQQQQVQPPPWHSKEQDHSLQQQQHQQDQGIGTSASWSSSSATALPKRKVVHLFSDSQLG